MFQFSESPNQPILNQDSNLFILLCISHRTQTAFLKPLQIATTSTNGFTGEQHNTASGQPEPRVSRGPPMEPPPVSPSLQRAESSSGCPSRGPSGAALKSKALCRALLRGCSCISPCILPCALQDHPVFLFALWDLLL